MAMNKQVLNEDERQDSEAIAEFLRGRPLDARVLCRAMLSAYTSGAKDTLRNLGVSSVQNPTAAGPGA